MNGSENSFFVASIEFVIEMENDLISENWNFRLVCVLEVSVGESSMDPS